MVFSVRRDTFGWDGDSTLFSQRRCFTRQAGTERASLLRDAAHAWLRFARAPSTPLDPFDIPQLAEVIRTCKTSATISDAGRQLFSVSRQERASRNDADRLRKYLAKFDLKWADLAEG